MGFLQQIGCCVLQPPLLLFPAGQKGRHLPCTGLKRAGVLLFGDAGVHARKYILNARLVQGRNVAPQRPSLAIRAASSSLGAVRQFIQYNGGVQLPANFPARRAIDRLMNEAQNAGSPAKKSVCCRAAKATPASRWGASDAGNCASASKCVYRWRSPALSGRPCASGWGRGGSRRTSTSINCSTTMTHGKAS